MLQMWFERLEVIALERLITPSQGHQILGMFSSRNPSETILTGQQANKSQLNYLGLMIERAESIRKIVPVVSEIKKTSF